MTVDVFLQRFGITNKRKVLDWIDKDYIPGTYTNDKGEYIIPDEALPPYTEARAKKRGSIFASLLKGILARKQVLPVLYKMSDTEFRQYIYELERQNLITIHVVRGIEYYYPTIKAEEFIQDSSRFRKLMRQFQPITEGIASGSVKGFLDYNETH